MGNLKYNFHKMIKCRRYHYSMSLLLFFLIFSCGSTFGFDSLDEEQEKELGIISRTITYPGATGDVLAYMAKPKGKGKWPAVVVIHDNEGITVATEEFVKYLASKGFYVIAPDGLSQISGTPDVHDAIVSSMDEVDYESTTRNFAAVIDFVKNNNYSNGSSATIGFGWGGQMAFDLITNSSDIDAAVSFNGFPRNENMLFEEVDVPVLFHYDSSMDLSKLRSAKLFAEMTGTTKLYSYTDLELDVQALEKSQGNKEDKLIWKRTLEFLENQVED